MPDKQRRARRQFTAEFKRDAVELVRTSGRPIAQVAAPSPHGSHPIPTCPDHRP